MLTIIKAICRKAAYLNLDTGVPCPLENTQPLSEIQARTHMPTIRNEVHNNYWGHKRAQKIHSHPKDTFCNCCKWRSPRIGLSFAESAGKAEKWKGTGKGGWRVIEFYVQDTCKCRTKAIVQWGFIRPGDPPTGSPFSIPRSPIGMWMRMRIRMWMWVRVWAYANCRQTHGAIIPNGHSRQSQLARFYECFPLCFSAV